MDKEFDGRLSDFEVIGVVKDVRFANLTRVDPDHVYLPPDHASVYPTLIRVKSGDASSALAAVRSAVQMSDRNLLPSLSLWNLETMFVNPRKSMAHALAVFAMILALLALSLESTVSWLTWSAGELRKSACA